MTDKVWSTIIHLMNVELQKIKSNNNKLNSNNK